MGSSGINAEYMGTRVKKGHRIGRARIHLFDGFPFPRSSVWRGPLQVAERRTRITKQEKLLNFFFLQNVNCELFLIELNIPFLSYFQLPFSKKLFPVFGAPKTPIRHCPYCCCCYILLVFVEHGKEGEDIEKI